MKTLKPGAVHLISVRIQHGLRTANAQSKSGCTELADIVLVKQPGLPVWRETVFPPRQRSHRQGHATTGIHADILPALPPPCGETARRILHAIIGNGFIPASRHIGEMNFHTCKSHIQISMRFTLHGTDKPQIRRIQRFQRKILRSNTDRIPLIMDT